MPNAAPRPCNHAGCGALVRDGSGRCEKHPRQAWAKRPDATKRITGRRLQQMRQSLFAREPFCQVCRPKGVLTLATQRDHVVSLEEGGADDETNEQAICDECHEAKSLAERLRARGAFGRGPGGV